LIFNSFHVFPIFLCFTFLTSVLHWFILLL